MKKIEVNQEDALARYLELTQIDGGSGGEIDVANRVIEMLTAAGLDESAIEFDGAETRTQIAGNCGNMIVKLPGNGSGPRTLLSAHMDTVPICLGCDPVVDGDFVYSRGDTGLGADNRAGCAAILTGAIERLKSGDVQFDPAVLLFTVQEEVGLKGAQQLDASKVGPVDRAFNFDGGAVDEAVVGAIGGERMDIKLTGIPAHAGGAPEKGASAIVMAAKAIAQLDESGWLGSIQRDGKFGTSNVGIINGGEATNVVTPEVALRAEARSHDAEFRIRIVNEIKQAFETAAAAVCNDEGSCGQCEFKSNVDYEAFPFTRR